MATRPELLAVLEAAALDYGRAYAAYSDAHARNGDTHRAMNRGRSAPFHPETKALCIATVAPHNALERAAFDLFAFDHPHAEEPVVAPGTESVEAAP